MSLIKGEVSVHGVTGIVLTPTYNIYEKEKDHAPAYSRTIRFINLDTQDKINTFEITLFADTEEALTTLTLEA